MASTKNCAISFKRNHGGRVRTFRFDSAEELFKNLKVEEIPKELLNGDFIKERGDFILGVETGQGVLRTNLLTEEHSFQNIDVSDSEFTNVGRTYVGTPTAVEGVYIPSAIRRKDISQVDLNKDTPLFNRLKEFLNKAVEQAFTGTESTFSRSIQDLRHIIYIGSKAGIPVRLKEENNQGVIRRYIEVSRGEDVVEVDVSKTTLTPNEQSEDGFDTVTDNSNVEDVFGALLEALVTVKAPFQVNSKNVNGKWNVDNTLDYNTVLIDAGVLTTNLVRNEVRDAYFVMNPIDENLKEKKIDNTPPKKTKAETSSNKNGVTNAKSIQGTTVIHNGVSYTKNENGEFIGNNGKAITNIQMIQELEAKSYVKELTKEERDVITIQKEELREVLGSFYEAMMKNEKVDKFYVLPDGNVLGINLLTYDGIIAKNIRDIYESKQKTSEEIIESQEETNEEPQERLDTIEEENQQDTSLQEFTLDGNKKHTIDPNTLEVIHHLNDGNNTQKVLSEDSKERRKVLAMYALENGYETVEYNKNTYVNIEGKVINATIGSKSLGNTVKSPSILSKFENLNQREVKTGEATRVFREGDSFKEGDITTGKREMFSFELNGETITGEGYRIHLKGFDNVLLYVGNNFKSKSTNYGKRWYIIAPSISKEFPVFEGFRVSLSEMMRFFKGELQNRLTQHKEFLEQIGVIFEDTRTEEKKKEQTKPKEHKGLNMITAFEGNQREGIQSTTTLEAIKNGEKTATTFVEVGDNLKEWKKVKVGDIVEFEGNNGEKVQVKVTKALHKLQGSGKTPSQWSQLEGWNRQHFNKEILPNIADAFQLEFEYLQEKENIDKPKTKPRTLGNSMIGTVVKSKDKQVKNKDIKEQTQSEIDKKVKENLKYQKENCDGIIRIK